MKGESHVVSIIVQELTAFIRRKLAALLKELY